MPYDTVWLPKAVAEVMGAEFFLIDDVGADIWEDGGSPEPFGLHKQCAEVLVNAAPEIDKQYVSDFDSALELIQGKIIGVICRQYLEGTAPSISFVWQDKSGAEHLVGLVLPEHVSLHNNPLNLNPSRWFFEWGDVNEFVEAYCYRANRNDW